MTAPIAGNKPDLVSRLRDALAGTPGVTERKMFGSAGFMVHGNLCLSARAERIMCRIDPALHDKAVARAGFKTVVIRGRSMTGLRECRGRRPDHAPRAGLLGTDGAGVQPNAGTRAAPGVVSSQTGWQGRDRNCTNVSNRIQSFDDCL